jgi:hypothetical protein
MFRYNLNLSTLQASPPRLNLTLRDRAVVLTVRLSSGDHPQYLDHIQGGVFTPGGNLYLVNGFLDKHYTPEGIGLYGDFGPTSASDTSANQLTRSCNGGPCSFNYAWTPGGTTAEEAEGLTWWPRSTSVAPVSPGIAGQLHVMMVDNDWPDADDVYLKHYRVE